MTLRMSIEARIADLKAKLEARRDNPSYRENVPAIEAEIKRLENLLSSATAAGE